MHKNFSKCVSTSIFTPCKACLCERHSLCMALLPWRTLEARGAPSHPLQLWAGSVIKLRLAFFCSVGSSVWGFIFLLLSSLSCCWKKLRGIFFLFLPLWGTAASSDATSPQFRHGCCRCAFSRLWRPFFSILFSVLSAFSCTHCQDFPQVPRV